MGQQRRGGLQVGAHGSQLPDGGVADGHDEVFTYEDPHDAGVHDLAGLGQRRVLDVLRRPHDEERDVLVALQLRPLFLVQDVLDREGVQPEDLGDAGEGLLVGFVQADPHERAFVGGGHDH